MTEDFTITAEPGFIRVVFATSGPSSSKGDNFSQVTDAARAAGVHKVLYDVRKATARLSTLERFDYASRIAKQFRGLKVAFVVNEMVRDPNLFGETVALNRGANIRVFTVSAEAYRWLEVGPTSEAACTDFE